MIIEDAIDFSDLLDLRPEPVYWTDKNGLPCGSTNGDITPAIRDIVKAVNTPFLDQPGAFCIAGQIYPAVAGENQIEKPKVLSDLASYAGISPGGQNELSSATLFFFQPRNQIAIIRERCNIWLDCLCQAFLE
jgi:hypothetical protein